MKFRLFIKVITVLSFILLISSFLLYRTGKLNSWLINNEPIIQTSHNGGKVYVIRTTNYDTIIPSRLSSSKSLVLTDNDPLTINKRKREYLFYAISFRSEIFQDSLRKMATPLPKLFQFKLDSIKFNNKDINWFYLK